MLGTVATVVLLLLNVTEVAALWTVLSVRVKVPILLRTIESVAGCRLARVGAGITVKEPALVPVPAKVMTAMGPVEAVGGTTATRVVGFVTVKVGARTPLNVTVCTFTKLLPVIVTDVPGWPLVGVNPADGRHRQSDIDLAGNARAVERDGDRGGAGGDGGDGNGQAGLAGGKGHGGWNGRDAGVRTGHGDRARRCGCRHECGRQVGSGSNCEVQGFGVSAVGCVPALVSSTLTVMKLPGALVRRISKVLVACSVTVRSSTATFCPKSLGPRICAPLSLMVAEEMRFVPLALPFTTCSV